MPASRIKFAIAQLNFLVGDIEGNCKKILAAIKQARAVWAPDCVVFSELALLGYPPEDLLLRPNISRRVERALARVQQATADLTVIIGAPCRAGRHQYNSAIVLQNKKVIGRYFKIVLPNYSVFDEKRYFTAGSQACVIDIKQVSVGVTICEDMWRAEPIALAKKAGAELMININASPYHTGKQQLREQQAARRVNESGLPLIYLNQVGGQDELVFDGHSFAINHCGQVICRAAICKQDLMLVEFNEHGNLLSEHSAPALQNDSALAYQVLTCGLREYMQKNRFNGGLIGLSGGIDSALALTLASDALGAHKVHAVMMPSQYTSDMSLEDARQLARNLNVKYDVIGIDSLVSAFTHALRAVSSNTEKDTSEENIQARIRGVLLMAISNKQGSMLISTGNKSEMAVGYATLYGDMAGGFAPLKDVPKTLVYALAKYRNSLSRVIPERIIERPPSAELAPQQLDQDSLPPYEILDRILELFIEQDRSRDEIIARGFDKETVFEVIKLVFRSEYKRRQAPPGIRISQRAFGKDRRYPITSGILNYLHEPVIK